MPEPAPDDSSTGTFSICETEYRQAGIQENTGAGHSGIEKNSGFLKISYFLFF